MPPIYLGDPAGGIRLSQLTDVVLRDANDFVPPAQISHAESSVPLSRLTDVLLRDANASAPDDQYVDGVSARAWSDRDNIVPRIVVRPWPLDPRMTPKGAAETLSNIGANVDPALADDRFDLREQGGPPPDAVTPTYNGSGNLAGNGTFMLRDAVEDRLVPTSWPGDTAGGIFGYTGQRIDPETSGDGHYRTRAYEPGWGRFAQAEPIQYPGARRWRGPASPIGPGTVDWRNQTEQAIMRLWRLWRRSAGGFGTGSGGDDGCREETREARKICTEAFADGWKSNQRVGPYNKPGGGPWTIQDCMRGLISERCGGNRVDK